MIGADYHPAGCNVKITADYWQKQKQKQKNHEGPGVISAAIWDQKDEVLPSPPVQDYTPSLQVSQNPNLQIIQNHALCWVIFLAFHQRRATIQQIVPNYCVFYFVAAWASVFKLAEKISN